MELKKAILLIVILILAGALIVGATSGFGNDDDELYQVSLLQSFMHGEYDGFVSVKDLKSHGDTGLGTFDGANGEMIFLDGVVYQADSDGNINVMEDSETVPFATVTHFDCDSKMSDISAKDFDDLTKQLDKKINETGVNQMYVMKIKAECKNITVRSVVKQEKPYDEFTEVAARDQKVFPHDNLNGTIIAVYFPDYMDKLNMHGWHLHFPI
ncbi:acetolactate decarboxylase [uncultured Methanobrevibacter sp.]|uniref:acetolactate decarboxylase n=1 Tax=uncultured Methanobrevibacter sp. TaxID=253161 RepID=UPI0025EA6E26|nr:acetolactate decarboxylase [uncultured Methanobrevibacter sp.]